MAVRSVATTQTLDNFRTTFNSLGTDVGDLSSLSTSAKGSIVLAINEINTSVTGTGFTLSDGSNTQTIVTGNTLLVTGTSISATVSATDTLTLAIASEIPENIFVPASALTAWSPCFQLLTRSLRLTTKEASLLIALTLGTHLS